MTTKQPDWEAIERAYQSGRTSLKRNELAHHSNTEAYYKNGLCVEKPLQRCPGYECKA